MAGALGGLCTWVHAIVSYVGMTGQAKKKREVLHVSEGKLRAANAKVAQAQAELEAAEAELVVQAQVLQRSEEELSKLRTSYLKRYLEQDETDKARELFEMLRQRGHTNRGHEALMSKYYDVGSTRRGTGGRRRKGRNTAA